jgi:hypothetical protein
MGRFEDMTIERPLYLTNKQGKAQKSAVGQANFEWVLGIFDDLPSSDLQRIIFRALDNLPMLPDDPAFYPAKGGLFKNGDNNGYTLTRLYGDRSITGTAIIDGFIRLFDASPAFPVDPLAIPGLAPNFYRDGDETGYRIIRKY